MRLAHFSERKEVEREALDLLAGTKIGLAVGNPLLGAALSMVPVLSGKVCWAVTKEKEALQEAAINKPDLVILTDVLEQGYGPSLVREIRQRHPDIKCLISLERETADVVEECLEVGCQGICFNSNVGAGDGDFLKALKAMANNAIYYPEEVRKKAGYVGSTPFAMVLPSDITEREKEVLIGLTEGLSNKELADTLFVSIDTVKSHLKNLTQKLGVRDRTGAAIYGIKCGISRS